MVGIRIAPDDNDIVVWKLDEASVPFVNSSTSPNALSPAVSNLTNSTGTFLTQQPSPFAGTGANTSLQFLGTNSGSPRNVVWGANTAQIQPPCTLSFWLYLRTYDFTGFTQHFINKQHTTNVWSGTFSQFGIQNRRYTSQPSAFDFFATCTGSGASIILDAHNNIPLNTWCHLGLVLESGNAYAYLNGNLVGQATYTGTINYGNNGPWFMGAVNGSGNPEEGQYSICDIRLANVARPQSYFQTVYREGMLTEGSGVPLTTYYKMRAFDTSCPTATPVYWVDTIVNYNNAPSPPCGGSLGPIEIVESWPLLGFAQAINPPTITDALNGLTWKLPNTGNLSATVSSTLANQSSSTILPGNPATTYNVTLRFRGVVEEKTYTGGTNDGSYFQIGGTPAADPYNVYSLTVSSPAQTYYLNRGVSGQAVVYQIDYNKTIQMNGGATITLSALSIDNQEIRNSSNIGIAGVTDPVQPYDGQFITMGVISVV